MSNEIQSTNFNSSSSLRKHFLNNQEAKTIIDEINKALSYRNYPLAIRHIKNLRKLEDNPLISLKLAHLHYLNNKFNKAEKIYRSLVFIPEKCILSELHFGLGQVYYELKDYSNSFYYYSQVLSFDPSYKLIGHINLKLAKISILMGNYEIAKLHLTQIAESKQENNEITGQAYCLLGYLTAQTDLNFGLDLTKHGIKIFPCFKTLSGLLLCLIKRSLEASEKLCNKLMIKCESDKEWNFTCFIRAVIFIKQMNYEKGLDILKNEVTTLNNEKVYNSFLGIAYYFLGKKAEACLIFQEIRRSHQYDLGNLNNLGKVYWELGLGDEAYFTACEMRVLMNQNEVDFSKLEIQESSLDLFKLCLSYLI